LLKEQKTGNCKIFVYILSVWGKEEKKMHNKKKCTIKSLVGKQDTVVTGHKNDLFTATKRSKMATKTNRLVL